MAQEALGLAQRAANAKGQLDSVVAPNLAGTAEHLVHKGGVDGRAANHVGTRNPVRINEVEEVVGQ